MKNFLLILTTSLLLLTVACSKQDFGNPRKESLVLSAPLPIDGTWEFGADTTAAFSSFGRIRIEGGIVYILDSSLLTGTVLIKDLQQTGPNSYEGIATPGMGAGKGHLELPAKIEVVSASELKVRVIQAPDAPLAERVLQPNTRYMKVMLDNDELFRESHPNAKLLPRNVKGVLEVVGLADSVVTSAPTVQHVDPGATVTIERSRTIEREIVFEDLALLEGKLGADVLAGVRAELRGQLQSRVGQSLQDTETFTARITLDGNQSTRWSLLWRDRIRQGVVRFSDGSGGQFEMAFTYLEGTEHEVRAIN